MLVIILCSVDTRVLEEVSVVIFWTLVVCVVVLREDNDVNSVNGKVVVLFENDSQNRSILVHRLLNSSTTD